MAKQSTRGSSFTARVMLTSSRRSSDRILIGASIAAMSSMVKASTLHPTPYTVIAIPPPNTDMMLTQAVAAICSSHVSSSARLPSARPIWCDHRRWIPANHTENYMTRASTTAQSLQSTSSSTATSAIQNISFPTRACKSAWTGSVVVSRVPQVCFGMPSANNFQERTQTCIFLFLRKFVHFSLIYLFFCKMVFFLHLHSV